MSDETTPPGSTDRVPATSAPRPAGGPAAAPSAGPFGPDGHPRRWAILAILVVSLLIVVLDNTVLNIALPTIQRDLDATQSELVWAIDAYVLVFAALLFTWGVLGDRYGRKRVLLIGLAIFAVGSALSAVARSPGQRSAFRAIMGIGGAAVIPVTLAIITVVFPPRERGRAIGAWAGAVGGAVALGPVLGGLLLENPQWFSWLIGNDFGSVFLINVPIVIIGSIGIARLVPESRNPHPQPLDVGGLVLSIAGLTAIVYGIIHAGDTKDWTAPSVLVPIIGGVLVVALFVVLEARSDHPSFDVSLFRNRGYTISLAAVSLSFFALSGVTFTFPFYLQTLRGFSTLVAGLCFLPFAVGQLLGAPRSAAMVARFGERAVLTVGLVVVAVALVYLTRLQIGTPLWAVLLAFFGFGLGLGNVIAPASTVMQNTLPLDRVGAGSAVQNTVRQVFGAFGVAITGTVVANQYADKLAPTLATLPPQVPQAAKDAMSSTVAAVPEVLSRAQQQGAPAALIQHVQSSAFTAFIEASHVATWLSAVMIILAAVIVAVGLPTIAAPSYAPAPGSEGDAVADGVATPIAGD
ncbi:MAG: DHA2 family efflux MFS transporter permease subunit [Kineosporiaceae bacterium]